MTVQRVAILGTGIIGGAFCRNLAEDGYDIHVYNRSSPKSAALRSCGVTVYRSPMEAVELCDIVIASLFDDAASRAVLSGATGAIAGMNAGSVLIETSTLSLEWVGVLAGVCEGSGIRFIDCPVFGSRGEVEGRSITFVASGDESAFDRVRSILERLSVRAVFVGASGNAMRMKLVNNLMNATQMAALAEAVRLAEGLGLDARGVLTLLENGSWGSPLIVNKVRKIVEGDRSVESALHTTVKDLGYIREASQQANLDLTVLDAVLATFAKAALSGYGAMDVCLGLVECLSSRT